MIEKSVLPQGRIYNYKGRIAGRSGIRGESHNKDIIEAVPSNNADYTHEHERAGSSIIANYTRNSQHDEHENSPKSYKMPANFRHGVDSQIDSLGGVAVPDSAGGGTHPIREDNIDVAGASRRRMPVHSFTTVPPGGKTMSSQVNTRK